MMSQRSTVVVMTHVVMIEEVMTLATWVSVFSTTIRTVISNIAKAFWAVGLGLDRKI